MGMTITLKIPDDLATKISAPASGLGQDADEYVSALIERDLESPRTLDEILAPVRRGFAERGVSEGEWTALVEDELREVRRERSAERSAA
jgi:hypothetical protein